MYSPPRSLLRTLIARPVSLCIWSRNFFMHAVASDFCLIQYIILKPEESSLNKIKILCSSGCDDIHGSTNICVYQVTNLLYSNPVHFPRKLLFVALSMYTTLTEICVSAADVESVHHVLLLHFPYHRVTHMSQPLVPYIQRSCCFLLDFNSLQCSCKCLGC
jgi:hypothetical protein